MGKTAQSAPPPGPANCERRPRARRRAKTLDASTGAAVRSGQLRDPCRGATAGQCCRETQLPPLAIHDPERASTRGVRESHSLKWANGEVPKKSQDRWAQSKILRVQQEGDQGREADLLSR